MGNHVFGCDICQDVCPWNRRAPISAILQFQPRVFPTSDENRDGTFPPSQDESFLLPKLEWLAQLTEADFRELFRGSPIKRTKWRGLVRNACIALGNSAPAAGSDHRERICTLLTRLRASGDPQIAESAQWALSRI
jgi:epoxyqueuosine reductase